MFSEQEKERLIMYDLIPICIGSACITKKKQKTYVLRQVMESIRNMTSRCIWHSYSWKRHLTEYHGKQLRNAMDEYEIPSELKRAITSTYGTCQSKVRVGAGEGEWFDTTSGVRHCRHSFPLLFMMCMDLVIREVVTTQEDHKYIYAGIC